MSNAAATYRSRLRATDVLRVGALGLRTRRLRTGLSTLGVAIGIAAFLFRSLLTVLERQLFPWRKPAGPAYIPAAAQVAAKAGTHAR